MCGCALSSCLREYGREMHCECAVCVCACGAQHVWLGCSFQLLMRLSWVELGSTPVWHVAGARRAKGHGEAEPTLQTCRPQCPRQVRKRFTIWVLRLGGRALALADRPRHASMSPARDAPRGTEKQSQPCRLAGRNAHAPCNRTASAKTVYDLGPTSWRPRAGLGRSFKKCEHWHVAGARRAKGHGEAEPTLQTCRPQRPRALQPHGKCENGLRSGP